MIILGVYHPADVIWPLTPYKIEVFQNERAPETERPLILIPSRRFAQFSPVIIAKEQTKPDVDKRAVDDQQNRCSSGVFDDIFPHG